MFELQYNLNGQQHAVKFDRFARIGAGADCEVRIADVSIPQHALTVVNEGVKGLRVMVKADGICVEQQATSNGASVYVRPGVTIQVGNIHCLLAEAAIAPLPVSPPKAVLQQPAASPSENESRPQASVSGEGLSKADTMAIAGIVICLLLVVGAICWMLFGDSESSKKTSKTPKTIASMIREVRSIKDWTVESIPQETLITELRNAYQLEARKRNLEAQRVIDKLRSTMLQSVPTDEYGHFVMTDTTPQSSDTGDGEDAKGKPNSVSVTKLWFTSEFEQQLFAFLSKKSSELKP